MNVLRPFQLIRNRSCAVARRLRAERLEDRSMLDAGWVAALGGAGNDRLWDMAGDAAGNTYIVGEFSGTANFGGKSLTSSGSSDVFVAKLNSSGQVQWATRAGGSGADLGYSIAADTGGNVLVTGHFTGSAKFGNTTLASSGSTDAFVAKLAGNNGKFQWAKKVGVSGDDRGLAVETDSSGNVLVTGGLNGAMFVYAEGMNTQYGATQLFVNKYSSSGTQLWSRTVTGAFAKASFEGLVVDSAGSVYVAGAFDGTANFPTGSLTSVSTSRDMLIGKLNSSGTWQWAESVSGTVDGDVRGAALSNGKLYVAGAFEGTVNLDAQALTSAGITDGFVASFDTATRSFEWAQRFGGTDLDIAREVATDLQGNVHVVGSYRDTADFGPQILVNPNPAGTTFVTMLSPAGAFLESISLGGPGSNSARNIAFDSAGNRYIGGHFEGVAEFSQGTVASAGAIDSYIVKLTQSAPAVVGSQFSNQLLAAAPTRRLPSKVADSVFVQLSEAGLNGRFGSFDEELLMEIASETSLQTAR